MNLFEQHIVLENAMAILRPLGPEDADAFRLIAFDPNIWQFTVAHINDEKDLQRYMQVAIKDKEKGMRYPFTIIDKQTGKIAGSTSFLNYSEQHSKVEIGATWMGTAFHRTGLNRACKFALLTYAFEQMGMERVEIKTGSKNVRSQNAIKGLGAIQEGILRSDTMLDNGTRRDTVYFSILRSEWPAVKERLEAL